MELKCFTTPINQLTVLMMGKMMVNVQIQKINHSQVMILNRQTQQLTLLIKSQILLIEEQTQLSEELTLMTE